MATDYTNAVDRISVNNGEPHPVIGMNLDGHYPGVDLTVKFASEIAASPYSGNPWAWIKGRITAKNYEGIHVGDYIPYTDAAATPKTRNARILGINTYKQYGDTAIGDHIDFWGGLWTPNKPINPVNYNNGLVPVETITSDGTSTTYTLTKPMYGVASVKLGSEEIPASGYTYNNETYVLTFTTAPAAGTLTVTGTGSEYPWLASDAYLYANSLAGHVANGTTVNPAIKRVDYTADGIFAKLPTALKNVIVEKKFYLEKRYSASGLLTESNAGGWVNIGKIWFPTECEVYGTPVWGGAQYAAMGSALQYPFFMGGMNRLAFGRTYWWLLTPYAGGSTYWCFVNLNGLASTLYASNTSIAAPICFRIA